MKTKNLYIIIFILFLVGCSDELDVKNYNEPTPEALLTESGIKSGASAVYSNMFFLDGGLGDFDFVWIALANHEIMGDAMYIPWGNFGWRWANQVSRITLDDGTVILPPQETDQALSLKKRNARAEVEGNAMAHEWITMYFVNNTSNLLLESLESGIDFTGDAVSKQAAIEAWAYFWKGYAYSRIGSMYVSGIINNEYGIVSNEYVARDAIITEANANFDKAITILNSITNPEGYTEVLNIVIPTGYKTLGKVPSPAEFVRVINTMKARNILINIKDANKTIADWNAIAVLCGDGMIAGDFDFIMNADGVNFIETAYVPARLLLGWHFASERLIQDFKAGDQRFTRNFEVLSSPQVNRSGRGIQYGTRYGYIEGDYASEQYNTTGAKAYIGPTYEENVLMQAEALINTGSIEAGLALIDDVRTLQNSGLADVENTGLSLAEAKEELRIERRIGLHLRGLAFYDARRWGVNDAVANGGGRTGCVVLDANGVVNTNATFEYKYMDYFDIPANELEFNAPTNSSITTEESPK